MKIRQRLLILSAMAVAACVPDTTADSGESPADTVPVIDGLYDQNPAACGNVNSDTRLTVQGDSFRFYESECTFGRKGGQPRAAEGTLICLGEGQRFNRNIRLDVQANVLRIIENGAARSYSRCPT